MKRSALIALPLLVLPLFSCNGSTEDNYIPKGVDLTVYSSNAYIGVNGTSYRLVTGDPKGEFSDVLYFSPKGVLCREVQYGKMLFNRYPMGTYYHEADNHFYYTIQTGIYQSRYECNFFTSASGKKTLQISGILNGEYEAVA